MKKPFVPFPVLTTMRLVLRQVELYDNKEIYKLRTDPNINRYLSRPQPATITDINEFINNINDGIRKGDWIYWAISLADKKALIGTICLWNLTEENESAEVGYELLPEYQNNGYTQESMQSVIRFGFKSMDLKKFYAYTHKDNIKSARLLEKFEFQKSGVNDTNPKEIVYLLSDRRDKAR